LGQPEGNIEISLPFDHLKCCFLNLAQVAFLDGQKPDNPVAGCVETMKYRFVDFTQDVFCCSQKAENEFSGFSIT
jgi:hypothetical protein